MSAALVALTPKSVVTVTSGAPVPAGVVAVIFVALLTVMLVARPEPKNTAAGFVKPVPVMVTTVDPVVGPVLGERPVTVGAAPNVNCCGAMPLPFGVVTTTLNGPV